MYFQEVKLTGFRNYEEELVSFHPKINIITGKNAQGKTNLLESLYIMSMGKSFRTSKDSELIGFDQETARVKSTLLRDGRDFSVEIYFMKDGKQIKVDGVKITKNADLMENVYVVIFSPEDLKIVKEEPEKRRKFIDRELCQIKRLYFRNFNRYRKVLQQRNFLLKQGEIDEEVLCVWDYELADYGARLILERKKFIEKLAGISREIHRKITDGKELLEVSYESNIPCVETLEEQKQIFIEHLKKSRKTDTFRRTTTVGPHKDDLKLCICGIDIRHYGSQGQQRTAALSLKMAEIELIKKETGEDAILLLDDVLSELDSERQKFLIHSLEQVQLFITTTEISEYLQDNLPEHGLFSVDHGKVERIV